MKMFEIDPARPEKDLVEEVVAILRQGGVIAYPTDTLYGLGGAGHSAEADHRIRILKGRISSKPFPYIIDAVERLEEWELPFSPIAEIIAKNFWPGPVSLIIKGSSKLPHHALDSQDRICVRVPEDKVARALAEGLDGLLIATSANPAGYPPARYAKDAIEYFKGELDATIDGGPSKSAKPSTIVDVSGNKVEIVREGAVRAEEIYSIIAEVQNKKRR